MLEVFRDRELDEVRLLLGGGGRPAELVAHARAAVRVGLGIRAEAVGVPAQSLPRDGLKARRLVRRESPPFPPSSSSPV